MVNSSSRNDFKNFKYTISNDYNVQTQGDKEDNKRPFGIDLCLIDGIG